MLRSMIAYVLALPVNRRLLLLGAWSITFAACMIVLGTWRYDSYRSAARVAILELKLKTLIEEQQIKEEALREALNGVYRSLYAVPEVKELPRRPLVIEGWQLKRDKDIQERLRLLELWRLRTER